MSKLFFVVSFFLILACRPLHSQLLEEESGDVGSSFGFLQAHVCGHWDGYPTVNGGIGFSGYTSMGGGPFYVGIVGITSRMQATDYLYLGVGGAWRLEREGNQGLFVTADFGWAQSYLQGNVLSAPLGTGLGMSGSVGWAFRVSESFPLLSVSLAQFYASTNKTYYPTAIRIGIGL